MGGGEEVPFSCVCVCTTEGVLIFSRLLQKFGQLSRFVQMSQIGITTDMLSFDKHIGDSPLMRLRQQFHLNDRTIVFR